MTTAHLGSIFMEAMEEEEVESRLLLSHSYTKNNYTIQEVMLTNEVRSPNEVVNQVKPTQLSPGKSSAFGAVFIVVNAALGAGLLTFPLAFYSAGGVFHGLLIEAILLLFIIVSLMVLAYAAELNQTSTYEDTVEAMCGPIAKFFSILCLVAFCFGATTAFLTVIGDQIVDITSAFDYHHHPLSGFWFVNRKFLITILSVVFILPWLFLRDIGVLSYTSFLSVLSCVYIATVVTVNHFLIDAADLPCNHSHLPELNIDNCSQSWMDIFNAIPFICFGYQCHVSSIPIYVSLKRRRLSVFSLVIIAAIIICLMVYTFTGVFGYLTFHGHYCLASDILRNYCPSNIMVDVARGLLIVVMVTSYPILTFCGRTALDSVLLQLFRVCKVVPKQVFVYNNVRLMVLSVLWFAASLTLALFVNKISYIISVTGGLAATFIFIFPGMIIIQFSFVLQSLSTLRKIVCLVFACCLIVIGTFIFGNSVIYSVMHDAKLI